MERSEGLRVSSQDNIQELEHNSCPDQVHSFHSPSGSLHYPATGKSHSVIELHGQTSNCVQDIFQRLHFDVSNQLVGFTRQYLEKLPQHSRRQKSNQFEPPRSFGKSSFWHLSFIQSLIPTSSLASQTLVMFNFAVHPRSCIRRQVELKTCLQKNRCVTRSHAGMINWHLAFHSFIINCNIFFLGEKGVYNQGSDCTQLSSCAWKVPASVCLCLTRVCWSLWVHLVWSTDCCTTV